jgi:hypothetical protein
MFATNSVRMASIFTHVRDEGMLGESDPSKATKTVSLVICNPVAY